MNQTTAQVETVLRARYQLAQSEERAAICPQLDLVCAALEGNLDPVAADAAQLHLSTCACCGSAANRPAVVPRQTLRWLLAALVIAAGVAVAIVPGWLESPTPDQESPLTPKGHGAVRGPADRLEVAVRRGKLEWVASALDTLETGDLVGFFYTADTDGYLLIAHVDAAMDATVVFPAGGQRSAPVHAGRSRQAVDSAVLTPANGCNWFVGVFSDEPIDSVRLREAISKMAVQDDCELDLRIPEARSVSVIPVLRRTSP